MKQIWSFYVGLAQRTQLIINKCINDVLYVHSQIHTPQELI